MGKLVESTFVTLDGSIGDPQAWRPPYWDDEHAAYARKLLFAAPTRCVLGRATYEGFAEAWPHAERRPTYTDRINAMPKYVASRTLARPTWNATILDGDAAEAVAALKGEEGGDLLKFGTGELDRTLLEHGLVDEFHFWIFPVLAGGGQRLIDGIETTHLELVETTRLASGIVVNTYTPKA